MIAAAAALLTLAAPVNGDPGETITLNRTQNVCAGFCPNYEFIVQFDGLVIATLVPAMGENQTWIFRVTPEEVAEFRDLMAGRSSGGRLTWLDCERDRASTGYPGLEPRIITWSGIPDSTLFRCISAATSPLLASLEGGLSTSPLARLVDPR